MSDQIYIPNPEAALVLSKLIEFGYLPHTPPELPDDWQQAYDAVHDVRRRDRDARSAAFREAIEDSPHAYEMYSEVTNATPATEDRGSKHRLMHVAEDALKDPPVLEWCVEGLLAQPSLTVLVGDPGSKKTYLALDLAACVALGKPWLGRSVNQCPVLLIDEETGLQQLWSRLNASLHAHQAGWDTPLHYISLGGYDLRDPKDAEELTHRALSIEARLIVIDALVGVMSGDENSLPSVQPALFHLRRMAEYCRAAVLVLHHTNRHGVFRGSSLISAVADLMLSIESSPEDSLLTIHTLKARHLAPPSFSARANFETTPEGKPRFYLSPAETVPANAAKLSPLSNFDNRGGAVSSILGFLAKNPNSTRKEVSAQLQNFSSGTIRNSLTRLMASGLVKKSKGHEKLKEPGYELSR